MENLVIGNAESLARLRDFLSRVKDDHLERGLKDGRNGKAILGHLAFYDLRAAALLEYWSAAGVRASPIDPEIVNEALLPVLQHLPVRAARDLALQAAERIDALIAAAPDSLITMILAQATQFHLARAIHRNAHLEELESLLA